MILIPAIDILGGKCVRLYKGDYETAYKVAEDPLETALSFAENGAKYIHMVDLDGAREGKRINSDVVRSVCSGSGLPIEIGGGIRDMAALDFYFDLGVSRCVIGSAATRNPEFVAEAVKKYSEKIAVGIDARDGKVAVSGWTVGTELDYIEFAKMNEALGVSNIIFTDIDRDGMQTGANLEQLSELKKAVSIRITASGGINDMNDVRALNDMGLYAAITGKAIYAGSLDLREANDYLSKENNK